MAERPTVERSVHDEWMESKGIPIYRGHHIEDLRTIDLEWWEERQCKAAFIQLAGQQRVSETRVSELSPGQVAPPLKMAFGEIVYVLEGRGVGTVWTEDTKRKTFEWEKHSLFLLPRHAWHQFSNMDGDKPARLLHFNHLPVGMTMVADPEFWFNNSFEGTPVLTADGNEFYAEAKAIERINPWGRGGKTEVRHEWYGNFFPDMRMWDQLDTMRGRGAGGHTVRIVFPGAEMDCHMSVFPERRYKKAHRHGPGYGIVIPAGEGYSVLWQEGQEKVIAPWHEGSMFVPPGGWFHQHFNVGNTPARYLALHPMYQLKKLGGMGENVLPGNSIEYADEEPWIRAKFEEELAKRGLQSDMPEQAYDDRDYQWAYAKSGG